jgi:hypothetical protein
VEQSAKHWLRKVGLPQSEAPRRNYFRRDWGQRSPEGNAGGGGAKTDGGLSPSGDQLMSMIRFNSLSQDLLGALVASGWNYDPAKGHHVNVEVGKGDSGLWCEWFVQISRVING